VKVLKAPDKGIYHMATTVSLFLAGSIDQGKAENWQERITRDLSDLNITIFNPRRNDWDSTLIQDITNPVFKEQVNWELDAMIRADIILMYFDKDGPAPITLLELGLHAKSDKIIVCCPEGYWRRGNVQIMCERFGIPFFNTYDEFRDFARKEIWRY